MRHTGVTSRGIITPIFKEGDNLVPLICESVLAASREENFRLNDGDIVAVTEAVVARTQGNYSTCVQITKDVKNKIGCGTIGLVFPILSRNRFAMILKGIAAAANEKLIIQLSYPSDEVGNAFLSIDAMDEKGIDPYRDSFDEAGFRAVFGKETYHRFTGVDYIEYYKSFGHNIEIIFSNDPKYILNYTKNVINCDIHTRKRTKKILMAAGAKKVLGLDDIMTQSVEGSGYNADYGLLGSNKATEDKVKLFPRDCDKFVADLHEALYKATGKKIEAMVYGDGCFKDPVGGIWEFADPVASPAYTPGLSGTPNEIKMKYFADNYFADLEGDELEKAMKAKILEKDKSLVGSMESEGTTPRRITDLLASLCDLTSGSGDRGTPVVLVQGYFTNFASE
jgi:F420-0:gamma-glutamyl ligase